MIHQQLFAAVCLFAMIWASITMVGAQAVSKKKSTGKVAAKSSSVKKASSKKGTSKVAASKKGVKKTARPTWRNTQRTPSPERYKEIQQALNQKGYLQGEASGVWNPESVEALKRFQQDQNLEPTGKITSLSLIALGLGPKYDRAEPPAVE